MRKTMYVRLAFLIPLAVAVFVLHLSGTALIELRVARIVVVALLLFGFAWFRRRRNGSG
jgi:uncharacterized membrane protein